MTNTTAAHLRIEDLLRFIDGEANPLERTHAETHIAACTRCAGAGDTLRADATLFSSTVRAAAWEAELPPRPSFAAIRQASALRPRARTAARAWEMTPAWLRAAVVLVMIAAPVAAVPSLRNWVLQQFSGNDTREVAPAVPASPPAPAVASSTVWFVPATPAFVVQLDALQARGAVRVRRAAGEEGSLTIENAGAEQPVYAATVLHIRNTAQSAASYVIDVPPTVRTLTIRIGESTLATIDAARITAGATVSLQR